MLPTVALVAWILSMLRPRFFPGRREVASFRKSYDVTTTATIAFLSAMGVVTLLAAQDESFPVIKAVFVGLGMLLIVVGNFFGKMRRNYFVGIRTPWTLSDGEVWLRTHRFGGKAFVLAGVVTVVGALMDLSALILTAPAVIAAAAAAVYSYVIYARTARMPGSSS